MTRGELLQQAIGLIDDRHLVLALARPSRHRLKLLPLVAAALAMVLMGVFVLGGLLPGRHGVIPPAVTTGGETASPSWTTGWETDSPSWTTGWESEPPYILDPDYEPGTESYPGGVSTLQGISEYQEFVRKYRMPEHFVAYEDIAALGQFTSLVFHPRQYLYNMRDSSGQETMITVYHSKCHGLDKLTYSRSDNEDMREMNGKSGTWTYQKIGPLSYHYYENRLIFVYMESEHLEFWITGGEQIHLYDTTKDTALSRLLTRSTAEAEAKALLAKIEKSTAETDPGKPGANDICHSLQEYQMLISTYPMPEHFLSVDVFDDFGTLDTFHLNGTSYLYTLRDDLGQLVQIIVYSKPRFNLEDSMYSEICNEDMRFIDDKQEEWVYVRVGPLTYHYYSGELIFISLKGEHHEIAFLGQDKLCDYHMEADASVSRLLMRSEAEEEATALLGMMNVEER